MIKKITLSTLCLILSCALFAQEYSLTSPDDNITVSVKIGKTVSYSVQYTDTPIVTESAIGMNFSNGTNIGQNMKVASIKKRFSQEDIKSPFYHSSNIVVSYNELIVNFKDKSGVIFRAYNEGVAYRFYTQKDTPVEVMSELAQFNFAGDYNAYLPYSTNKKNKYCMSFQNVYDKTPLSKFDTTNVAFLPVTIEINGDMKVTLLESDLESYPGMFVVGNGNTSLAGEFASYPVKTKIHPTRCQEMVDQRALYIAKTTGARSFPWRILAITADDTLMPVNPLVYALAKPAEGDFSWVKPGKIAWDWWNNWGIYGVDFKVGVNTLTYKHFIDFAADNSIEYVVLDEGWSKPSKGDVMSVIDQIDLNELVEYGKQKNIDLILWVVANVLDDKLEEACKHYSAMGIKGFKIDFIDRDDQKAIELTERIVSIAAKHKMLIDLHGASKPVGLNRTYPNLINVEGVFGMEELKWSNPDMPMYNVTMPFIRMMAGPVDYTPGAMKNAVKSDFKDIYKSPMSQGTRCHQLAIYIVFDAPLVALCDSPTAYSKEQECVDFITKLPVVADQTKILQGKIGEYIVTLRKVKDEWFVGGLTNWNSREVTLSFDFLGEGEYTVELFRDGINADTQGEDYIHEFIKVNKDSTIVLKLAGGGGFAMKLTK